MGVCLSHIQTGKRGRNAPLNVTDEWFLEGLSVGQPTVGGTRRQQYGTAFIVKHEDLLATGEYAAVLLKLSDASPAADILWRGKPRTAVYCVNGTPFLEDTMIYGCDASTRALMGVRLEDGQRLWQTFEPTMGGPGSRRPTAGSGRARSSTPRRSRSASTSRKGSSNRLGSPRSGWFALWENGARIGETPH
jgi:hypothetical protein